MTVSMATGDPYCAIHGWYCGNGWNCGRAYIPFPGYYYTPDIISPYIGSRPVTTPYVCPLCSGNGGAKCNEDGTYIRDCFPCNGTGIVWSPVQA